MYGGSWYRKDKKEIPEYINRGAKRASIADQGGYGREDNYARRSFRHSHVSGKVPARERARTLPRRPWTLSRIRHLSGIVEPWRLAIGRNGRSGNRRAGNVADDARLRSFRRRNGDRDGHGCKRQVGRGYTGAPQSPCRIRFIAHG